MCVFEVGGYKIKLVDEDCILRVEPIRPEFPFDAHGEFVEAVFAFGWKILSWEVPFFIHNWFSVK